MPKRHLTVLPVIAICLAFSPAAQAGGLLADKENKIVIEGRFTAPKPEFLFVFSAKPWQDARGKPLVALTSVQLAELKGDKAQAVIRLSGKDAVRPGRFEFFFGSEKDADMPWNDGRDFHWKDWEKLSSDVWDNLSIVVPPAEKAKATKGSFGITAVAVIKGGKILYDSRMTASYPNKRKIAVALKPFDAAPQQGRIPVLNLGDRMESFRNLYYELGNNPILSAAYADLGQTEKRKYANRGTNWCSEFASWVYRENKIMTPDPNRGDVHWKNVREFFEKNGHVYPAREVARWPDEKKRALIKPGSFVSLLIGESTHSIVFTTWIAERGGPITRWVGVSGNNKGMVWPHAPIKLPTPDNFSGKSPDELRDYDLKVYFAVPNDGK